jgi:hypothetical protein
VSAGYFEHLGCGAYHGVAESARGGYGALYAELAGAFGRMVRVLASLPGSALPEDERLFALAASTRMQ